MSDLEVKKGDKVLNPTSGKLGVVDKIADEYGGVYGLIKWEDGTQGLYYVPFIQGMKINKENKNG